MDTVIVTTMDSTHPVSCAGHGIGAIRITSHLTIDAPGAPFLMPLRAPPGTKLRVAFNYRLCAIATKMRDHDH
ncbi:MAG: hypothetical protein H6641_01980 [Caldilineaceae bacterium]|nr:hypothetical protein [Caldilineaceae bacterium]